MRYSPSFDHLQPLVDALIESGNPSTSDGFRTNQGGADCVMRDLVDLQIIQPLIEADEHASKIKADAEGVHCLHCWASIRNPAG
ncbi:hypothetical protein [Nocardioides marmorisolisilvae]|uniref:Uncharacterized protein n=1 Tax=Nocardioides marmorisolisilvae TaxID=1542737 RepID=A0A3N0DQ49_9ACTN|nr:hypothetical protein [Nocardioides marmorisolisilvae]RNL77768.1 hypothetical protein EFL95_17400 [Nocardioides marmorisolisilvae]